MDALADLGHIDLLIVGGGTSGATLAGIIARDTDQQVLLLEAGPDYGALTAGRWPRDLLEARWLPGTHSWGYGGHAHPTHERETPFDRARVIGGCSAHNGCVALIGHRHDYDRWEELGNTGWAWDAVAPAVERAKRGLRVRLVDDSELTPFHAAFIAGAVAAGVPQVRDMNDPDQDQGVAASPVNIFERTRWNSALGYLDPVRERPNLRILGDMLVDRVEIANGRAIAVQAISGGRRVRIPAAKIVLAAGAYATPAILLRSGIGPADDLRALGITPMHALPGVGKNLVDHPTVEVHFAGTDRLNQAMESFRADHWLPDEQTLAKVRSSRCTEAFDLHLYAVITRPEQFGRWRYRVYVSSVLPRSIGTVTIRSTDPEAAPVIDHGYLSDVAGEDSAVIADGIALARAIGSAPGVVELFGAETRPGPGHETPEAIADFIRRTIGIYYHPTSSCRMGPASNPDAVVDPRGAVHGLDGLAICDASIFPTLMRANTNLPAAMIAEHMAGWLAR
jgi:choline dehydrogenase-like flavoprotein